jgi:hypothetical protein
MPSPVRTYWPGSGGARLYLSQFQQPSHQRRIGLQRCTMGENQRRNDAAQECFELARPAFPKFESYHDAALSSLYVQV